jgi:hypothetical protein
VQLEETAHEAVTKRTRLLIRGHRRHEADVVGEGALEAS